MISTREVLRQSFPSRNLKKTFRIYSSLHSPPPLSTKHVTASLIQQKCNAFWPRGLSPRYSDKLTKLHPTMSQGGFLVPHNPETQLPLPGPLPGVPHVSLMTCPWALLCRGQGPQTQMRDLIPQPNACGRSHRHLGAVIGSKAEALIRWLLTSALPRAMPPAVCYERIF